MMDAMMFFQHFSQGIDAHLAQVYIWKHVGKTFMLNQFISLRKTL